MKFKVGDKVTPVEGSELQKSSFWADCKIGFLVIVETHNFVRKFVVSNGLCEQRVNQDEITKIKLVTIPEAIAEKIDFHKDDEDNHLINVANEDVVRTWLKNKEMWEILISAVYIGYKIGSPFTTGDWVTRKGDLPVTYKVTEESIARTNYYYDSFRTATEEEIKKEKSDQMWMSLGRDVNEYKTGDIVKDIVDNRIMHVQEGDSENKVVHCSYDDSGFVYKIKEDNLKLIVPVEKRMDYDELIPIPYK